MPAMTDVSPVFGAYLRSIYNLHEDGVPARRARVSERLGQAGPTVSQTVNRLHDAGLVMIGSDGLLELTGTGTAFAIASTRRHRLAERLMTDVLNMPIQRVHAEATRWAHSLGRDVELATARLIGEPWVSPWGNPIPGLDELGIVGVPDPPAPTMLGTLPRTREPVMAVVRLVSEDTQDDPQRITELINAGVLPGTRVTIVAHQRSYTVRGISPVELPAKLSHSIQVDIVAQAGANSTA